LGRLSVLNYVSEYKLIIKEVHIILKARIAVEHISGQTDWLLSLLCFILFLSII